MHFCLLVYISIISRIRAHLAYARTINAAQKYKKKCIYTKKCKKKCKKFAYFKKKQYLCTRF